MIEAIHHVQLAMPKGGEEAARAFYAGALGMTEIAKPDALSGRGGCWFQAGTVELHLGVETPFAPARKAHPALRVRDLARAKAQLDRAGIVMRHDVDLPGFIRVFVDDPFGNRIEILQTRQAADA